MMIDLVQYGNELSMSLIQAPKSLLTWVPSPTIRTICQGIAIVLAVWVVAKIIFMLMRPGGRFDIKWLVVNIIAIGALLSPEIAAKAAYSLMVMSEYVIGIIQGFLSDI